MLTYNFTILDYEHKAVEVILEKPLFLFCVIVYKNSLGMAFKEKVGFSIGYKSKKDIENLKLCLKTKKTAEIDFGKQIEEFAKLTSQDRNQEAEKIFDEIKEELSKRFGEKETLDLDIDIATGSFSVNPISESEYLKILSERKKTYEKIYGTDT